jgi:hypothetical protein
LEFDPEKVQNQAARSKKVLKSSSRADHFKALIFKAILTISATHLLFATCVSPKFHPVQSGTDFLNSAVVLEGVLCGWNGRSVTTDHLEDCT